jgi:alpha-N-arabinofuranosidase
MMNETHHYEIAVTLRDGKRAAIVRRRIGSLTSEVACRPLPDGPVILRIDAEKEWYTFSVAAPDAEPVRLARGETRYLSTEVASGFTGVYIAMFATASGYAADNAAHFDYFEYAPTSA